MATDQELENHGKLVRLDTLFTGMREDMQKLNHKQDAQTLAIEAVNNNLVRLENTIERKDAYQKGKKVAAYSIFGVVSGAIGAKLTYVFDRLF
jgi:hypothetical protein